jgi:hypothetical protein
VRAGGFARVALLLQGPAQVMDDRGDQKRGLVRPEVQA